MARQILIVDDIKSNREILKNILGDEYDILEAVNGEEAVALMERDYRELSAVLLDLGMPVMDGFEVLSYMQKSETLSQLPVIVTTGQTDSDSEEKALKLGAKDYISKPYKTTIIKQRIWNTIDLRETSAAINALQRDRLTGLYSREAFFEKTAVLVSAHLPGHYIMACFDVDSFKVINDQYGTEKGDEVLRHIAETFRAGFAPCGGICCRVTADNFAVLYPAAAISEAELAAIRERAAVVQGLVSTLTFSIGRYVISDLSLSPSAMFDRASLAENSVKGRYDHNIALYDESMREFLLTEQRIVTEMDEALRSRQFEAWFQPQYNHATGALIGAEVLARWRHPREGLIPPASFIPLFEKNGFVYELDKFIWEESCRYLRKWLDEGRAPLPVSVNISRYDVFRPDLIEVLTGLLARYAIPVELLRLEITESAFASSTRQIVTVVKKLLAHGFTVEIDDFGSGYSSLNTLKSVPAQVVKLDMRFIEGDDDAGRSGNILESIVRMAKWLGMSVIAEGVEERAQADFLKSIGCSYVQGYLYAHPMTAAEYEAHCKGADKEERLLTIETVENLDNNAFWDPKSMDTLIFNSYVGAACISEYHDGREELLRINDKYAAAFGPDVSSEDIYKYRTMDYMDSANREILLENIRTAIATGQEATCETVVEGLYGVKKPVYIRSTVQVIARAGNRYLLYCTINNTTARHEAEQSERRALKQLQAVLDNVNCGITAVTVKGETVEYLMANDRYYELLGYTRQQYQQEIGSNAFGTLHPDDRESVSAVIARIYETNELTRMEFRALRRDGSTVWLRCNVSMTAFEGVEGKVQLTTYVDVTGEKLAAQELLDNLPGGAALYEYDGKTISATHLNKRYWELVNRTPVSHANLSVLDAVHPDDRTVIARALESAIKNNTDVVCDIRVRHGKEGYRSFRIVGRIVQKPDGKYAIYASYTPASDESISIREVLPAALRTMMDSQSDYSFIKDRELRYICCSHAVYETFGLASEAELIGKTDYDLSEKSVADDYTAADRRIIETGEPIIDSVYRLNMPDGREHYSSTSKYPLKDTHGNVIGIYAVGRDVTEDRAIKSELELLTNNLPGGIAIYEGRPEALDKIRLSYFSDGFCCLFGYTRAEYAELAEKNPLGLVFAQDMPAVKGQIKALLTDNKPLDLVYRARTKDGSYKWINLKAVMGEPHGENLTVNAVLIDVSERQETLERLRISEQENRLAMQHSNNVVCRYNVATRMLTLSPSVSPKFELGDTLRDVPYSEVENGRISPETAGEYIAFYERILRGESDGEVTFQRKSNTGWRWLEAHFSTIFSDDGKPASAVVSYTDVTESFEKDAAYKRWRQSMQDKKPESYSLYRCNISTKTAIDEPEGSLLRIRFKPESFSFDAHTQEYAAQYVLPEDVERFKAFLNADALLADYYQGKRIVKLEYRETLPKDKFRWLRLTVDLVEHPLSTDVEAYMLFEDIDKEKRTELATRELAETDPLTGVLNRATFAARVDKRIRASGPDVRNALMMLDIDGFKQVNDAFGHAAGDQVLIDVAEALRSTLRHGDLVGRLGGDEFVVFMTDLPSESIAANKARQICALTRKAFSVEVEISGSVGIAVTPRDGTDFETLYKKADSALYYVKGSGKDSYAFYHSDMADETLVLEKNPQKSVVPAIGVKKRRMLIVDDNKIDHAMLTNIFIDDFIVEKAKDGSSALIRLRHYGSAISVVLLDLIMPGIDGFAVLEKMQQSAELRNIPVIVVSGDGSRETGLRAIRAGAVDFVLKPVDADLLRLRVQAAVTKGENERLRAKNSLLEYQNGEVARYRTVLERSGIIVVEHDWVNGSFVYDPNISAHIAGNFDGRKLWHILLADLVADTATVKEIQELVHGVAADRQRTEESIFVRLKTPSKALHWFRMNVYKVINEFGLTGKIYLTFTDLGAEHLSHAADLTKGENDER